ncbi:uncharacterized protein [Amphiura filiformis]|uniref:uncharacterized protein n=1 Tax=Amphiura filiformis TaxID=82378 RepID=UPI003B21CE48
MDGRILVLVLATVITKTSAAVCSDGFIALRFRCAVAPADESYEDCVPLPWVCDGIIDCLNSRDEDSCEVGTPCDEDLCYSLGICTIVQSSGASGGINCDCLSGISDQYCQSQNTNQIPQPTLDLITHNSVRLTWNQPPPVFQGNADAVITNYNVTLNPADGSQPLAFDDVPATAGSYVISGLTPGTTYAIDTDYVVSRRTGEQPQPFNVDLPSQTFNTSAGVPPVTAQPVIDEIMSTSARITFPGPVPVLPDGPVALYFTIAYPPDSNTVVTTRLISAAQGASDTLSGLTPGSCFRVVFSGALPGDQELMPVGYSDQTICTPVPPVVVQPVIDEIMSTSARITFPGPAPVLPGGPVTSYFLIAYPIGSDIPVTTAVISATQGASDTLRSLVPGSCFRVEFRGTISGAQEVMSVGYSNQNICTPAMVTIAPVIDRITGSSFRITFPGDQPSTVPNDPEGRMLVGYLVTLTDTVTGSSVSMVINAQPGASYTFNNLAAGTMYSVNIAVIAETASGNQQIAQLEIPTEIVTPSAGEPESLSLSPEQWQKFMENFEQLQADTLLDSERFREPEIYSREIIPELTPEQRAILQGLERYSDLFVEEDIARDVQRRRRRATSRICESSFPKSTMLVTVSENDMNHAGYVGQLVEINNRIQWAFNEECKTDSCAGVLCECFKERRTVSALIYNIQAAGAMGTNNIPMQWKQVHIYSCRGGV